VLSLARAWDRYARGRPGILRWRLDRLQEAGVAFAEESKGR